MQGEPLKCHKRAALLLTQASDCLYGEIALEDCLDTDAWIRASVLVDRVMLAPYRFSDVVGGVVIVQLKCSRRPSD